jgi:hypothetical protein
MLDYLLKGLNARNRETEAHFLVVESTLMPIEKRIEAAKELEGHLERFIGDVNASLNIYTFLAVFGNVPERNDLDDDYAEYDGVDGVIRLKSLSFTKDDWKEARKMVKYNRDSSRTKATRYIDRQDAASLFDFISGDHVDFEDMYQMDSLRMAGDFINRIRRLAVIREMSDALLVVPNSASEMNIGRLWIVPAMASYSTGQKINSNMKHDWMGFEIDCLCSSYRFDIMLDMLHVLNSREKKTELYAAENGKLEFFNHATIPPWAGLTYKK